MKYIRRIEPEESVDDFYGASLSGRYDISANNLPSGLPDSYASTSNGFVEVQYYPRISTTMQFVFEINGSYGLNNVWVRRYTTSWSNYSTIYSR